MCNFLKLQYIYHDLFINTDVGSVPEIAQYGTFTTSLRTFSLLPKDLALMFYMLLLQLVLCHV